MHYQQMVGLGCTTVHQPSVWRSPGILVQTRQSSGNKGMWFHWRQLAVLASQLPQQVVRAGTVSRYESVACYVSVAHDFFQSFQMYAHSRDAVKFILFLQIV